MVYENKSLYTIKIDEDVEALFCAIFIIQLDGINKASNEWKKDEEVWPLIQKLQKIPIQTILPELEEEGKIILEPGAVTKTRTDSYEIDQF